MPALFTQRWPRWAVCWLLLCQIQGLSVIDRAIYGNIWLGKSGDIFTEIVILSQLILSTILFAAGLRRRPFLEKGATICLLLAVFQLCSAAWSADPGATVRLGIQYFFFMLGLIGAAKVIEGDDFMNLLALVCFWSGVASVSLIFISPSLADGGSGDLIGIFSYKGILGQAMALGGLACLHGLRVKTRSRLSSLLMILLFLFVAIKCRSTTSALIILLFYVVGTVMTLLHRGGGARVLGVILLIPLFLAAPVAAISPDSMLELLGKDPTLTGRTDIWGYVIPYIYQRPLLGWGYGAFFSTLNPAAWEVASSMHWFAPEAHNGLLDILLSSGLVGAVWFIYLWIRTVRLSLQCMRYDSGMAITCFSCCAGVLVGGIDEQVLQYVTGLAGAFFITSFFCEQTVSTARRRHPVASAHFVRARSIRVAAS